MVSQPTVARRVVAAAVLGCGFAYALVVKLARGSTVVVAPDWLAGVLPNFVGAALVPLAVLVSARMLTLREYLLFVVLILIGLCGYEVVQLWMPRRTFDWNDLWASGAGALVAVVLGLGFFRPSRPDT